MAKKRTTASSARGKTRIDVSEYGINFDDLLDEIRPNLSGTHAEIGERAGMPATSVCNILNGSVKLSLGMLAAIADASGGQLVVSYKPPRKRRNAKSAG